MSIMGNDLTISAVHAYRNDPILFRKETHKVPVQYRAINIEECLPA